MRICRDILRTSGAAYILRTSGAAYTVTIMVGLTFMASTAVARPLETTDPREVNGRYKGSTSIASESASGWDQIKSKVTTWWSGWTDESTTPTPRAEVAQNPSQPAARLPAQAAAVEMPTTGAAATVSSAPALTAAPVGSLASFGKSLSLVSTSKEGRAADAKLKRTSSGVPTFDLVTTKKGGKGLKIKVDKIPLLDIGEEAQLVAKDFILPDARFPNLSAEHIKALPAPAMLSEKDLKAFYNIVFERVRPLEKLGLSFLEGEDVVTRARVDGVKWTFGSESSVQEFPFVKLTEEDMRALRALILVAKKDSCHVSTGLLYTLVDSKNENYKTMANLHLGFCLHEMGLYTESIKRLIEVIKRGKSDYMVDAATRLVKDLPREFEEEVAKALKDFEVGWLPESAHDNFHYVMAKGLSLSSEFKAAEKHAALVSTKHAQYNQAQYILSVCEYVSGKVQSSLDRQKELFNRLEGSSKDPGLVALVAMNLGRTAFQDKKFDEAAQYYLKIRKDNPFWVQALTEQGWAQLQKRDAEGAIGNMYSIHSPYFKMVYKPDSYVVRTIGYLNLCQYGDAYRTLSQLEAMYRPWSQNIDTFLKRSPSPNITYNALLQYLKSPSLSTVEGLPAQVLREAGRNRDYLNVQEAINNRVDEMEQYTFLVSLIERDRDKIKWKQGKAQQRIADLEASITKSKVDTNLVKNIPEWKAQISFEKDLVEFYKFHVSVFEEGKRGMFHFKDFAKARLIKTKDELKLAAGRILNNRLKGMRQELMAILDNNELLRYEVFAASGENIRFHLAGGAEAAEVAAGEAQAKADKADVVSGTHRVPATAKPKSKQLQWAFDGEYWEDEIGNYRSSLKNNCPKGHSPAALNR